MGKTKTKYPVEITIQFIHPVIRQSYNQKVVTMKMTSSPLRFNQIQKMYKQFLEEFNISTPAILQWISDDNRQQITQNFQIDVFRILDEFGGTFTIIVQSYIQVLIEQINEDIGNIYQEIQFIKDRLNDLPTREEFLAIKKTPIPALTHNQSNIAPINLPDKKLDLGILFSEPIFDELRKKPAANPVDFRSEIQRLNTALKSSIKADINIKCQIATKQNLKHLIKFLQPKILHIICHGTSQGALEFQDDSRTVLGALQIVKTDEIIETLRSCVQTLPQVVFVNSCYSQRVGEAFFQMGVSYVIAIDSEDTIEDEAAQIFSEHFYRNIFSGEKVKEAFIEAKERVKMKHNSFGCCCRHSSKQKHKKNCRWLQLIKKSPNSDSIDEQQKLEKHKLFHVPSDLCKCQLKHLNRHKQNCEWARQALFHINNDFRIPDGEGFRFPKFKSEFPSYLPKDELVICCCFNYEGSEDCTEFRLPHSESNKFKIFENKQKIKNQVVFDVSGSAGKQLYKQLNDYTAPELVQTHEKIQSSIMGRQRQIYEFMKRIKDLNQTVYIVYGPVGVGRTSFVLKCVTYLIERRVFELYFYIDLYGIKDKDVFRYKFNEITKFNYDGEVKVNEVKNKMMVIILDNADDFFQLQRDQLYDELRNLRQELHKTKLILTFKEENCSAFDFERVHSEKYALEPLTIQAATKLIFSKMRHLFDITVQYNQIDGIVRSNDALRIPKFIESLCQSFSTAKKKIKIGEIKKKLEAILEGDMGGNKLIEENLKTLKERSQASYNLLLFMSQFSEGISIDDFKMLSIYDKKDSKIHLPIGKNWQTVFATLFQKKYTSQELQRQTMQTDGNLTQDSDLSNPSLKNIHSIAHHRKESFAENAKQNQKFINEQSYFLDEVSQNRYIVKRFIRDFIWKKHESPQNYYMKHIFVGYMAVMLEIYFKWLVNSKYIHEDLVEYSSVSQAGLFGFKNNVFNVSFSLTESVRIAKEYNSEFQRLVSEHPTVVDKIKKSDPSLFIANHKQDFLNIYEKRWDVVFQYLKEKKTMEDKICIGYLQNLMLFIPTAFKIAKVEASLLKYIISKSMSLLERLRKYSESQNYSQNQKILAIQLKLQLMRASIDLQKIDIQTLKSDLQLNKQLTIKLVKSINDDKIIEYMKKYWTFEKTYMLMYKQYISRKQSTTKGSYIDKNKSPYEKLKLMIENLISWLGENWDQAEEILTAKRNLIIGLMYLNVLKLNSGAINVHTNTVRLKKQHQKTILKLLNESAYYFKSRDLMKLCLRAKLTYIEIYAGQIINPRKKTPKSEQFANQNNQLYEELTQTQKKTQQCESIYTDRKNNLIGFMEFDNQIKYLKKLLKQKFWQISSNTLVCMRPVPLTINGETPIIQNLVRKKNKFRKEIQKIVNPQIDLCSKFQILTASKLKEEVQNGCTMLVLTSNVKIYQKKPFLVFEGVRMEEDLVQINHKFVQEYDLSKIKICMIVGNNSYEAIRQLSNILEDPPILISLGNTIYNKYDDFSKDPNDYKKPEDLQIFAIEDKRKVEIAFLKMFVKMVMEIQINSKEQILQICSNCENIVKGILELRVLSQKRVSPIEIKHKKGTYKDLSPGYQKNHNIDMKLKSTDNASNFICLRRWKDTYRVLQHIRRRVQTAKKNQSNQEKNSNPASYINVFGDIGSGKSSFVQQIARLFVERQRYSSGVYIIDGKLLDKKYQGDFESYFAKESEAGKFMTLQEFEQNGNENLMLIIDDFHMIKPKSNGRFNLFLQKIVEKRVNLIIVTNNQYNEKIQTEDKKKQKRIFQIMRPIKMQRLCPLEIDLIASNILDLRNQKLLQKYEQLKEKNYGDIRVQDIIQLQNAFYGKKKHHDFMVFDSRQMKKMQSNQG